MKFLYIFLAIWLLISCLIPIEAGLFGASKKKEKICGSNGITYVNRYEFERSQEFYKKLRRRLEMVNEGPCPKEKQLKT